jgi:uncharacterized protein YqiB (DUF1249 family)
MTEADLTTNTNSALFALTQRQLNARKLSKIAPGLGPLSYLLNLYEENFDLVRQLLGPVRNYSGAHLSHVPGKPPLWLEIIEQQPYTSILRITHSFNTAHAEALGRLVLDPNAYVRIYHDTKQAETTHCFVGAELKKLYSMDVSVREVNEKRLQMTVFFNKWLRYLLDSGHNPNSFAAVDTMPRAPASPILAPTRVVR